MKSGASSSLRPGQHNEDGKCCSSFVESMVSTCVLCVCCPLSMVWCSLTLPLKMLWRVSRFLLRPPCCCVPRTRPVDSAYSSFSETELNFESHQRSRFIQNHGQPDKHKEVEAKRKYFNIAGVTI
ncbi:hypothetical protein AMTRI_Chr12g268570 [Amborella trichopoda]